MAGGGLFNEDGVTIIQNSTITENNAPFLMGSGVASRGVAEVETQVLSTIIAGNQSSDVDFVMGITISLTSLGFNLIGNGNAVSFVFTNHDQTGVTNPQLSTLADNGGPTPTHSVLLASPALNAGANPLELVFDRRGVTFPRVQGNAPDVGAFELPDGDFNDDGFYNCDDINALTDQIASGNNDSHFDLNGDGLVDLDDQSQWLVQAGTVNLASGNPYLNGDANLDGDVDVLDFNIWNANRFRAETAWCLGNFNGDDLVDVSDFAIWNVGKFTSANGGGGLAPLPVTPGESYSSLSLRTRENDASTRLVRELPVRTNNGAARRGSTHTS